MQIFDPVRKKFVDLSPEEWVRQHYIRFLAEERNYPLSLFSVERGLKLNSTNKRTDILIYKNSKEIFLLVECKAPEVAITKKVVEQSLRYNLTHNSQYIAISNGLKHFVLDIEGRILNDVPFFDSATNL